MYGFSVDNQRMNKSRQWEKSAKFRH